MKPKGRSGSNPQSDYSTIGNEFEKVMQEFEQPFKEFKYQMKEFDRFNAEFEELMKVHEIEEFEKEFKKYDRFFNDPAGYKKNMDMLIRSSGISPEEFYKYIHKRIRKSKSQDLSCY